jgi:hypothetical protein
VNDYGVWERVVSKGKGVKVNREKWEVKCGMNRESREVNWEKSMNQ